MALWVTLVDAETYFLTRLNAAAWSGTDAVKTAALTTAQADIEASGYFTFDADEDPTDAQKAAVYEQALFLLVNPDMEARLALQAQNVLQAGIIQETYSGARGGVIIAPRAHALLTSGGFGNADSNSFRFER